MENRLKAARKLKRYADGCRDGSVAKDLAMKCYRACVMSMLKKENGFSVTFKGKHFYSFSERTKNWTLYVTNNIKAKLNPKNAIFYDCYKPIHLKHSNTPNEWVLQKFLKECGFKIKEEHIGLVDIIYDIVEV